MLFSSISTEQFLPGKFHRQRSLVGYNQQGCKKSDMSKWLSSTSVQQRTMFKCSWTLPKSYYQFMFSSVQLLSLVWLFATPWTAACQASLSITNSRNLLKLMSIESVMPSNHLILCRPLLLPPPTFPSIRVFSNESVLCIRWPKDWSLSFSISPSNEYSELISFRMDWLDLLAVLGTLKSLLQHHSSKAPFLQHSAFFIVLIIFQLSFFWQVWKASNSYMSCHLFSCIRQSEIIFH